MNQAHIDDYLARSGDEELSQGDIEENEYGFCVWRVHDDKLVLVNVYGDGIFWNRWAEMKAKELGLIRIFCATTRNPQGFIRKHGFKLVGHLLERQV